MFIVEPLPRLPAGPTLPIDQRDGRVTALHVRHGGRASSLLRRFPLAVVRMAINQLDFWRSRREHGILKLSRRLDPVSREIVLQHVLLPRCQAITQSMQRKALRGRLREGRRLAKRASPSLTQSVRQVAGLAHAAPTVADELHRQR